MLRVMRTRRTPRFALGAAVALLTAFAPGPSRAETGVTPLPCEQMGASPDFARDGTAFCGGTVMSGYAPTGLALFVTTNHGRSWRHAAAVGLPYKAGDRMTDLVVSPRFASDSTIVVTVLFEGVFVSADAGESFTPALLGSWPAVTAFVSGIAASESTQRTLLLVPRWTTGTPAIVDPVLRTIQPVPGPPEPARAVLVSPTWVQDHAAVAFTQTGSGEGLRVSLYGCNEVFECSTRLGALPVGQAFHRAWLAADFATSRTMFVELVTDQEVAPPRLYVSRDGGRTFASMRPAQALVDAHFRDPRHDYEPVAAIDVGAPGSDRVWLRVYGTESATRPAIELFRSDDNGRTWTRVAYRRIVTRGARGGMQDVRVPPRALQPRVLLAATSNGYLFVNGIVRGGWGVSCSADAGRTWTTACR